MSESSMINEPSVFKPLRFYTTRESQVCPSKGDHTNQTDICLLYQRLPQRREASHFYTSRLWKTIPTPEKEIPKYLHIFVCF